MDPYDIQLTYEQRAEARRRIRKQKLSSQSTNHTLINGTSTPEDDKDFTITNVLTKQLTDPTLLQNGVLGKTDIVAVNSNGVAKHPSSSSEDYDHDISPGALCNDNMGSVGSFSTPEGKSLSSINEAWCDTNNNSTSDVSELSLPDSLLCEMGSDAVSISNTSATSSVVNDDVIKHPLVSHLTNNTTKQQRSKSESPSSSLKRNRKFSANNMSTSMEIPSVEDDDEEMTEDFSLRRSKYAPIRRKRNSVATSCPSFEKFGDLGPMSHLLGRLEETSETDGSLKSSPESLRKPIDRLHHKSTIPSTPANAQTQHVVGQKSVDKVYKPHDHSATKTKSGLVTRKPPLPLTKTDSSGSTKQRRKSVKDLLFPRKMSLKSTNSPPVETVVEQPPKNVTTPKVKKAARRAPLGGFISRLSPKRDIPNMNDDKSTNKSTDNKKEETKHKQVKKHSITKSNSHSGSSILSHTSSNNSITSANAFQGQKSSSFMITKEPLKSSPSETSFASREASISVESLLSDGSTDILLAHSNHDLFSTSSHEDLLVDDSMISPQHRHTDSEPLPSDISQVDDTPLKLEDITLITDEDDMGPSPAILVSSPINSPSKNLAAIKDSPDHHHGSSNLYKARSMEVLSESKFMTEVEVVTSITPASNLPSTVSVSTQNLSSLSNKKKYGITVSTVKKCASLDLLAVSKKPVPTATITVSSRKTPTKVKPTPFSGSVHKVEGGKEEVVREKEQAVREKEQATLHVGGNTGAAKSVVNNQKNQTSSSPISRQSSGRRLSGASSPFTRTSSRASTGRNKTNVVSPTSNLNVSAKSNSPAKKTTTIVVKSTRVNTTPAKAGVVSSTPRSTRLTDSSSHSNPQRVVSPTKSPSVRRPSMQRVSSGRKKSTEKITAKSPVMQSPSPQQQRIPFTSLFPAKGGRRIGRVSSDEIPVNTSNINDVIHSRSSSEIVTNNVASPSGGLSDIVENKMLITSSVETLSSDRVTSSMSDTSCLQRAASTDTPVRRISSGPVPNKTAPGSQTPARKRSVTGQTRPFSSTLDRRSSINQHHSDSVLKRPGSAATRRTSSNMRPSVSGTMPRQLTKTKSDSKMGSSTLPRAHRVSESGPSPDTTASKKTVRPHSAAISRTGSQAVARSSARRISLAPTSSAGRLTRSSVTRRSKSTIAQPDINQLKPSEENKKVDEVDGAKMSKSTSNSILSDVKPKALDLSRRTSTTLRSSGRRTSTATKQADSGNLKDARSSTARSSRRLSKAASVATVTHSITPNRKMSVQRAMSTPKHESSLSTSDLADLDSVKSADRLQSSSHRRFVRPKMRQKPSQGHLRLLMERNDVTSDISPDLNCLRKSRIDPNSYSTYMGKKNLAASAVAGLASVENFAAVKLRRTTKNQEDMSGGSSAGVTFSTPSVSLIHIKGRRKVRSRLVNPTRASVNAEDVFVLVTPTEMFQYVGAKANVLEKAKGAEIVQRIHQKKELGCTASTYHTIEEGKPSSKENLFWEILGGKKPNHSTESGPSDELYEKTLPTSWVLYEFNGEKDHGKFVAVHEKQTGLPKKEVLKTNKIFLYDCGHEAYVWVGKQSTVDHRKQALQQARKIFDDSCNMPDFAHMDSRSRPHSGRIRSKMTARKLSGAGFGSAGTFKVKHCERPNWALFVRLNEGSETVLFREKFADWPDESRIIKMKGHSTTEPVVKQLELKPCDISKMLIPQPLFQGLVLEGDNVYRGTGRLEPHSASGTKVISLSITKWLIRDTTRIVVAQPNHGIFHSGEGYVVRWSYRLCTMRKLEGLSDTPSRHATYSNGIESDARYMESGGRDKVAYFYWQGDDSSIVGKGTTAYSTVELDEERASQVRVVQGKEPAAFRNLWGGAMITLLQNSDINPLEHSNDGNARLYEVSGQQNTEAALLQMKKPDDRCSLAACLRSRNSYILHDIAGNRLFVWKGVKTSNILRQSAVTAAEKLNKRLPNLQIVYIAESEEPAEFWSLLGGKWKYPSLVSDLRKHDFTPRLFELSSVTQEFLATEVLHPCRSSDGMAFPFLQSDLYHASQPAIFLLDAHYEIFVWFGWWWKEQNNVTTSTTLNSTTTGSLVSRWLRDKELALETAKQYAKACTSFRTIQVYVVYAGTEHDDFIQHFPYWVVDKQVQQLNCKDIKPLPKKVYIDDELKKYTKMCYTLEELTQRPLPTEVDPTKMEMYLTDHSFQMAFKKTREEYYKLPVWKQTALKKEAGLF